MFWNIWLRLTVMLKQLLLGLFSNAEGAYGSNVNQLVDSSSFEEEMSWLMHMKLEKALLTEPMVSQSKIRNY